MGDEEDGDDKDKDWDLPDTFRSYLNNPYFIDRHLEAVMVGKQEKRTHRRRRRKRINWGEAKAAAFRYFEENRKELVREYESRLFSILEKPKAKAFLRILSKEWSDGYSLRYNWPGVRSLKASIKAYLKSKARSERSFVIQDRETDAEPLLSVAEVETLLLAT